MKRTKLCLGMIASLGFFFFLVSSSRAEIDAGDYVISGSAEIGGLAGHRSGSEAKYDEYRQAGPNKWIVPELQFFLGGKKEDIFVDFDATKAGYRDQNFKLRFGRYGLVDIEAEWDQIPHLFSEGVARTPYSRDGGTFTLSSKPASTAGTDVRDWVNANARRIDLGLLYGIGRFKIRYTPVPGWTFSGGYWSQHVGGDRAFGTLFGPNPGAFNITELAEPIDYQTHNVELGAEYAGNGWSLGLKYNGSFFHNNISTLIWDNPITSGVGSGCQDSATYSNAAGTGPCRGRLDLYPSNQAHTLTLTGAAALPLNTRFMGTASYGWRLQDDPFLPMTINSCFGSGAPPASCKDVGRTPLPSMNIHSLNGDVRPLMINATLVNNFFDGVHLKAYERFYDLENRSRRLNLPDGFVINDSAISSDSEKSTPYAYSKNDVGAEAGYDFTRWLTAKLGYNWQRMHREFREIRNSDEHSVGPTVDVKPWSWFLFRASYKYFSRNAPNYQLDEENLAKKFDEAKRIRHKGSLFSQISPLETLTFHAGFEFTNDRFPSSEIGTQYDFNYSPSVGLIYAPLDWLKLFGDYNWERFDWRLNGIQRSSESQNPADNCPDGGGVNRCWESRGRDKIHTFSIGSDMSLIENVLGFRIQYGLSFGRSQVHAVGPCATCSTPNPTNYPTIKNTWHELLARFEYQIHKNVGLKFGYYFNRSRERDFGVDIMKPWMGDVDPGAGVQRSIFLGDRIKGPVTVHVGFVALKLSF
jgi:MtrB/PioB family decaheme-associated outer membrane protein